MWKLIRRPPRRPPSWSPVFYAGAALALCGSVSLWADGRSFAVEAEKSHDRDGQAINLVATRCTICHSADLIAQQRLNRSRWAATLDKMLQWGAQLDGRERGLLLEYLSRHYREEPNPPSSP